nr:alanine racemase [Clostridia bacterium]
MSTDKRTLRTWVEIDYSAIRENYLAAKDRVPTGTGVVAIVKSDAYGHGAVNTAKALGADADFFGVACIAEAIELRESGVTQPILILGYTSPELYDDIVKYAIHPAIFGITEAKALAEAAKAQNTETGCFIALDTGMNRIGFKTYGGEKQGSVDTIKQISELEGLRIDGIFSHFFASDSTDKTNAHTQKRRFTEFDAALKNAGVSYKWRTLYNSPAIMDLPLDSAFEFVREGIMLYGLKTTDGGNVNKIPTRPALSLRSRVTHIKTVPAGEGISYGHTYIAETDRRIATVAAGYADGIPRLLSNKGKVIINGKFAPITGRVCMDQLMVDVTDIPDAKVGD